MKNFACTLLTIAVLFASCSKKSDDSWSEEDRAYHEHVLTLQQTAAENYETYLQTMDSADAVLQLQLYFMADSAVVSAEVGSQGIAVQYSNGIRGGIFINPEDEFDTSAFILNQNLKAEPLDKIEKSLVNKKKAILLNPHYWQRSGNTNNLIANFNNNLPKAGIGLDAVYKNQDATLDRFTQLSGYGFIHIYSHGWAWPEKENYVEVYLLTGEIVNSASSVKYWDEILNGNILLGESRTGNNTWNNVYYIRKNFIAAHNDFSKDTVLFYGGFCFSHLGTWPEIEQTFGNGAYFGYSWRVNTTWNCRLAKSLIENMTDTLSAPSCTAEKWWSNPVPAKSLWDNEDNKFCNILYSGDPGLKLLKDPELYYGKRYGGGIIFQLETNGKHGLIMAETDQSTGAPFGCNEILIGGTSNEFGTGQANTTALVNGCGEAGIAARICDDLVLNGFSDWYLPSRQELYYMYLASDDFGSFSNGIYWSSSELYPNMAWALDFSDGADINEFKDVPRYVRAIRAF